MYRRLWREPGGFAYPDFFGGVDVVDGQIVLLIVEGMLEDAKAHGAFSHFFDDGAGYRYVTFSFAELMDTRAQVVAAIEARPGCFYADNALPPYIQAFSNIVVVTVNLNNAGGRDMEAGFLQYVFDSPMLSVSSAFNFPL